MFSCLFKIASYHVLSICSIVLSLFLLRFKKSSHYFSSIHFKVIYPFPSYSRKSKMQPLCQCLMLTDTFPSLRQREDLKALIPFTHTPNSYVLSTYSKSVYDPCVCACLLGGWGCHLFLQFLTHRDLFFGESGYFRTHFGQCILKFTFRNNLRPRMILPSSRENFCFGRYVEALKI